MVWCESSFRENAFRYEPKGGTSWGLFQLWDKEHDQHRDNLIMHIITGVTFLNDCKARAAGVFWVAVAFYNGGWDPPRSSLDWGDRVEKTRDNLALYVWRHLR